MQDPFALHCNRGRVEADRVLAWFQLGIATVAFVRCGHLFSSTDKLTVIVAGLLATTCLVWSAVAPANYTVRREAAVAVLRLWFFFPPVVGLVIRSIANGARLWDDKDVGLLPDAPFFILFIFASEVVPLFNFAFSWRLRLLPHLAVQAGMVAGAASRAPAFCACAAMQHPEALRSTASIFRVLARAARPLGPLPSPGALGSEGTCWATLVSLQVFGGFLLPSALLAMEESAAFQRFRLRAPQTYRPRWAEACYTICPPDGRWPRRRWAQLALAGSLAFGSVWSLAVKAAGGTDPGKGV